MWFLCNVQSVRRSTSFFSRVFAPLVMTDASGVEAVPPAPFSAFQLAFYSITNIFFLSFVFSTFC